MRRAGPSGDRLALDVPRRRSGEVAPQLAKLRRVSRESEPIEVGATMGRTDVASEEHTFAGTVAHLRDEPRAVREQGPFARRRQAETHER